MKYGRIQAICLVMIIILFSCLAIADEVVVAFERKEYSVLLGKTDMIKPVVQGTKAKGKFIYLSSDESIATVKNGKVKGESVGSTTISCSVDLNGNIYTCSYLIHVLQPVEEISITNKEMVLPSSVHLRENPFFVLPENAANKAVEIVSSNPKIANVDSDGRIATGIKYGSAVLTCKATDGSGVKASFKITVPKGAWFSSGKEIIIDNPAGKSFYYIPTFARLGTDFVTTVYGYCTNGVAEEGEGGYRLHHQMLESVWEEFLNDKPFDMDRRVYASPVKVHLYPLKVGSGEYVVETCGDRASIKITVERSAVYENISYDQYQKSEQKNYSMRFQVSGSICSIQESNIFLCYDGDETKMVLISIPESIDFSSLLFGDMISVKGIFTGMVEYKTETGLNKLIPSLIAEEINK